MALILFSQVSFTCVCGISYPASFSVLFMPDPLNSNQQLSVGRKNKPPASIHQIHVVIIFLPVFMVTFGQAFSFCILEEIEYTAPCVTPDRQPKLGASLYEPFDCVIGYPHGSPQLDSFKDSIETYKKSTNFVSYSLWFQLPKHIPSHT